MYYYLACVTLVGALYLSFVSAQPDQAPVRIFTNTGNAHAKSMAYLSGCSAFGDVVVVTNSTTKCLVRASNTGSVNFTTCPTGVAGANSIVCFSSVSYCFATNPTNSSIVALTLEGYVVSGSFGNTVLRNPNFVTTIKYAAPIAYTILTDFNSTHIGVYQLAFNTLDSTGSITLIVSIPSVSKAAGLFATQASFTVAGVRSTKLTTYNYLGHIISSNFDSLTFANIQTINRDSTSSFLFVGDNNTVKKFDLSGASVQTFTVPLTPVMTAHARDAHFIVDANGVLKISKAALTLTSYNYANATCGRYSTINTQISGGIAPYTYILNPSWSTVVNTYETSNSFQASIDKPINDVLLYNNGALDTHLNVAGQYNIEDRYSTTVVRPGSTYSYSVISVAGGTSFFWCPQCINLAYYHTFEIWLNIGNGGQYFQFHTYSSQDIRVFRPGDLPLNTWVKLTFDMRAFPLYTGYFEFRDLSTTANATNSNPLYFDGVKLFAYKDMRPVVRVRDACGAEVSTPHIPLTLAGAFTVKTSVPTTSCVDGKPRSDASIVANVTGGVAPFSYSWSFSNSTTNSANNLGPIHNNMVLYDNDIRAPFSFGPTATALFQDSTYSHSAPYSYSFAPQGYFDGIYFYLNTPLQIADYTAFEFWINAGPHGGQSLTAQVSTGYNYPLNSLEYYANNIPFLPANEWVKVTMPIDTTTQATEFFGIQIVGFPNQPQERVYIDDVVLIAKTYVTVTDSTGCTASSFAIEVKSGCTSNSFPPPTTTSSTSGTFCSTTSKYSTSTTGKASSTMSTGESSTTKSSSTATSNDKASTSTTGKSATTKSSTSTTSKSSTTGKSATTKVSSTSTTGKSSSTSTIGNSSTSKYATASASTIGGTTTGTRSFDSQCDVTYIQTLSANWTSNNQQWSVWSVTIQTHSFPLYAVELSVATSAMSFAPWNIDQVGSSNIYTLPAWQYHNGAIPAGSSYVTFGYQLDSASSASFSLSNVACIQSKECPLHVVPHVESTWISGAYSYRNVVLEITNQAATAAANVDLRFNFHDGAYLTSQWNMDPKPAYTASQVNATFTCSLWNLSPGANSSGCGYIYAVLTANLQATNVGVSVASAVCV